ncbi:hypothetical protein AB0G15_19990 [Streptosporangium sp. NPDC023825]|uniref:hypothetical protein n=1 Tax=Streptosporangium sp. NPDC023825 TaxID=3154909 RepID=UPI00343DEBE0
MVKVGDVAAVPLPQGGHGACQVGGISADGWVTVCMLDRYFEVMPTLDDSLGHEPNRTAPTLPERFSHFPPVARSQAHQPRDNSLEIPSDR